MFFKSPRKFQVCLQFGTHTVGLFFLLTVMLLTPAISAVFTVNSPAWNIALVFLWAYMYAICVF